jgi:hypothetical protein
MSLAAAVRVTLALAAALSLVVARRRPDYRPVAGFLVAVAVASGLRLLLRIELPSLALPRVPASVPRHLLHLDQALYLVWPAALAALALAVCLASRRWPAVIAWGLALATLVGLGLRPTLVTRLYSFAELGAVCLLLGALCQWSGRDKVPRLPQLATCLIVVFAGLAAVSTRSDVARQWPSALACFLVLYSCLILLQGGALWIRGTQR